MTGYVFLVLSILCGIATAILGIRNRRGEHVPALPAFMFVTSFCIAVAGVGFWLE